MQAIQKIPFGGTIHVLGFGSIGQGVLPLLQRHFDAKAIRVITADERGAHVAKECGVPHTVQPLLKHNFREALADVKPNDFILNVTVEVSSVDMMKFSQERGALYLDTVVEPWAGYYADPDLTVSQRSNYNLRETMTALKGKGKPTCVSTHGANPGLVSHFVKQALLNIASDTGLEHDEPTDKDSWAALSQELGVKTIHVAERDTQVSDTMPKRIGEFVNTWSIDGFIDEGLQPAELGWGTHEKALPPDGHRHETGCDAAIYLNRPGMSTRVRTWTPMEGPLHGFLVTHNEAISISDYLTARDEKGNVVYRPTTHYAYHPCDDAVLSCHELAGHAWDRQATQRLMMDEISSGVDELGVLLMGHKKTSYWYGSQLSVDDARRLVPYNNATSLQVTAAALAGMAWAIKNPMEGVVEAEDMDHKLVLDVAGPYLGPVVGAYSDWTPLHNRGLLFDEEVDREDPFQFSNFRVQ